MLQWVPIYLPLFFYIKSVNFINFLLVCILTAYLLKFQFAKPMIQSMLCLMLLLALSFQIDKCMMGLRQLLQMLTCCQHQMMICLVTILKKKISLTCTLYSHVSFVFELAHGCISYVCWPREVASFFFLHKGILIALTVAFAKFSSLGLSKDSSYASHGVLLVGFIWL